MPDKRCMYCGGECKNDSLNCCDGCILITKSKDEFIDELTCHIVEWHNLYRECLELDLHPSPIHSEGDWEYQRACEGKYLVLERIKELINADRTN